MATQAKTGLEKELAKKNKDLLLMQEQLQSLMKQVEILSQSKTAIKPSDISSRKIKVVSLMDCPLTLSTEKYGAGKQYHFPSYGSERTIRGDDLELIISTCKQIATETNTPLSFFEKGLIYICDEEAIKEYGLEEYYDKDLDKKGLNTIVELKSQSDVQQFANLSKDLQETVVSLIAKRINTGVNYDLNLLADVNKIYGADVNEYAQNLKRTSK